MTRKIIIDTDPGQDDAIAILMAIGAATEIDIIGIVAVAGNVSVDQTYINARAICELADPDHILHIPVFRGSDAPLQRNLVTCAGFHGSNGLADIQIRPSLRMHQNISGIEFYVKTLSAHIDDPVTLCALGPLTNLATVLRARPELAKALSVLILMGGAFLPHGNITPAAEFNMSVDPEAAEVVLSVLRQYEIEVVVIPLDVTHQTAIREYDINRLRNLGNQSGKFAADILSRWGSKPSYANLGGIPLHDPCVIAYLLEPNIFSGRYVNLEIETQGRWTAGMTVVDWWNESGRETNVKFLTEINRADYIDLLVSRIGNLL